MKVRAGIGIVVVLACAMAPSASARDVHANRASGGEFLLVSARVVAGGGASDGGGYTLVGTVAQHDAGGASVAGDDAVRGGIRRQREAPGAVLFSDGFE